jgi:hypothetical protein
LFILGKKTAEQLCVPRFKALYARDLLFEALDQVIEKVIGGGWDPEAVRVSAPPCKNRFRPKPGPVMEVVIGARIGMEEENHPRPTLRQAIVSRCRLVLQFLNQAKAYLLGEGT